MPRHRRNRQKQNAEKKWNKMSQEEQNAIWARRRQGMESRNWFVVKDGIFQQIPFDQVDINADGWGQDPGPRAPEAEAAWGNQDSGVGPGMDATNHHRHQWEGAQYIDAYGYEWVRNDESDAGDDGGENEDKNVEGDVPTPTSATPSDVEGAGDVEDRLADAAHDAPSEFAQTAQPSEPSPGLGSETPVASFAVNLPQNTTPIITGANAPAQTSGSSPRTTTPVRGGSPRNQCFKCGGYGHVALHCPQEGLAAIPANIAANLSRGVGQPAYEPVQPSQAAPISQQPYSGRASPYSGQAPPYYGPPPQTHQPPYSGQVIPYHGQPAQGNQPAYSGQPMPYYGQGNRGQGNRGQGAYGPSNYGQGNASYQQQQQQQGMVQRANSSGFAGSANPPRFVPRAGSPGFVPGASNDRRSSTPSVAVQQTIHALRERVDDQNRQNMTLQNQMKANEHKCSEEKSALRKELEEQRELRKKAEVRLQEAEQEALKLRKAKELAEAKLWKAEYELQTANSNIARLEQERSEQDQKHLEELANKDEQHQLELEVLEATVNQTQDNLHAANRETANEKLKVENAERDRITAEKDSQRIKGDLDYANRQLKEAQDGRIALRTEKAKMTQQIVNLTKDAHRKDTEIEKLHNLNAANSPDVVKNLHEQLAEANKKYDVAQNNSDDDRVKANDLQDQVKNLQNKVKSFENQDKDKDDYINRLTNHLDEKDSEIEKLKRKLEETASSAQNVQEENRILNERIDQLNANSQDYSELLIQHKKLQDESEKSRRLAVDHEHLKTAYEGLLKRFEEVEGECHTSITKIEELETENETFRAAIDEQNRSMSPVRQAVRADQDIPSFDDQSETDFEDDNGDGDCPQCGCPRGTTIHSDQDEVTRLTNQLSSEKEESKHQLEAAKSKLSDLTAVRDKLQKDFDTVTEEGAEIREQLMSMQEEYDVVQKKHDGLQESLMAMTRERDGLQGLLKSVTGERDEAVVTLAATAEDAESLVPLTEERDQAYADLATMTRSRDALQERLTASTKELEQANAKLDKTQKDLTATAALRDQLQKDLEARDADGKDQTTLPSTTDQLVKDRDEIARLNTACTELEKERNEVRNKLADMTDERDVLLQYKEQTELLATTEEELDEAKDEITRLKDTLATTTTTRNELQDHLIAMTRERDNLEEDLAKREAEVRGQCEKQLVKRTKERDDARDERDRLQDAQDELTATKNQLEVVARQREKAREELGRPCPHCRLRRNDKPEAGNVIVYVSRHNPIMCWVQVYIDLFSIFLFWSSSIKTIVTRLINRIRGRDTDFVPADPASAVNNKRRLPSYWTTFFYLAIHLLFYWFIYEAYKVFSERQLWFDANAIPERLILEYRRRQTESHSMMDHLELPEIVQSFIYEVENWLNVDRTTPG